MVWMIIIIILPIIVKNLKTNLNFQEFSVVNIVSTFEIKIEKRLIFIRISRSL